MNVELLSCNGVSAPVDVHLFAIKRLLNFFFCRLSAEVGLTASVTSTNSVQTASKNPHSTRASMKVKDVVLMFL